MSLVRLLDRMEEAGWIERRPDAADRRARRLFLGEKAKPILDTTQRLADGIRHEALAGFSKEQQGLFINMLRHIPGNLATLQPIPAETPPTDAAAGWTPSLQPRRPP